MKVIARLIVSATLALAGAAHACDRQCTAAWFNSDPKTRISETGPTLSAYGEEGNAGMEAVSRCKMDVAVVMQGKPAYHQFIKQCYRLYPARVRDQMYHVDYRYVPTDRVDVYIHIDNKKPR